MITMILMLLCLHRTVLYLCTALCFALSLFLYACTYAMHVRFSYVYSTRIQRVYAAVHSYSCICLLCSVACSLGAIAYILLYMRSLPSSMVVQSCTWYGYRTGVMPRSTLTLLFLFGCCRFTSAFIMPCSGLFTDCPCTLFVLYVSTHVLLVAILFFGWCLCTSCKKECWLLLLFLDKLILIFSSLD